MEKRYIVSDEFRGCLTFLAWFGVGSSIAIAAAWKLIAIGVDDRLAAAVFLGFIVSSQFLSCVLRSRRH